MNTRSPSAQCAPYHITCASTLVGVGVLFANCFVQMFSVEILIMFSISKFPRNRRPQVHHDHVRGRVRPVPKGFGSASRSSTISTCRLPAQPALSDWGRARNCTPRTPGTRGWWWEIWPTRRRNVNMRRKTTSRMRFLFLNFYFRNFAQKKFKKHFKFFEHKKQHPGLQGIGAHRSCWRRGSYVPLRGWLVGCRFLFWD